MVLTACRSEFDALLECIAESDCIKKGGKVKECMHDPETKDLCDKQRYSYFLCRRGQVDMRTRIRGPRHGAELEKAGFDVTDDENE